MYLYQNCNEIWVFCKQRSFFKNTNSYSITYTGIKDFDIKSIKEKKKLYRIKNKDTIKENMRQNYINNKDSIQEKKRLYQIKNKDIINEKKRQNYKNKIKEKMSQQQTNNEDSIKEKKRQY